jgi:hypothetical protein
MVAFSFTTSGGNPKSQVPNPKETPTPKPKEAATLKDPLEFGA